MVDLEAGNAVQPLSARLTSEVVVDVARLQVGCPTGSLNSGEPVESGYIKIRRWLFERRYLRRVADLPNVLRKMGMCVEHALPFIRWDDDLLVVTVNLRLQSDLASVRVQKLQHLS